METKLFVGNLSYDTTEEDLRTLFAQAGTVSSVALITERETGRSKGFAFVAMASRADADNAIQMFNGSLLADRALKVDIARPREEQPFSGYGNRSGGYGKRSGQGNWRDRDRNRRGGVRSRRY